MPSSQPARPAWALPIACTILDQLGGAPALKLMLGTGVQFHVEYEAERGAGVRVSGLNPAELGGTVTGFRVLLAPSDTYDVEILEGSGEAQRVVYSVDDIYDDMLIECIESRTGYALRSPFAGVAQSQRGPQPGLFG